MECVACSIRNQVDFNNSSNAKSSNWELETLSHLGPILRNPVPTDIKEAPPLNIFKALIKKMGTQKLPSQIMQSLYYSCRVR